MGLSIGEYTALDVYYIDTSRRWDLKMGQRGQLDRLLVAHSAAVTSLDWCSTSSNHSSGDMAAGGLGWIVSGGLDHCVKVRRKPRPSSFFGLLSPRYGISLRQAIFSTNPHIPSIRHSLSAE